MKRSIWAETRFTSDVGTLQAKSLIICITMVLDEPTTTFWSYGEIIRYNFWKQEKIRIEIQFKFVSIQTSSLRVWDEENRISFINSSNKPVILWSSHLTDPAHIEKYLSNERYVTISGSNNWKIWKLIFCVCIVTLFRHGCHKRIRYQKNCWPRAISL